jgi:asparagine synthase (glutamine-hydrolysing)
MTKINLFENRGFHWYNNDTIFVKGYFFDKDNNLFEKEEMMQFFSDNLSPDYFFKKIKEINGLFSIIIKTPDYTYIASDIARSFPLFYITNNNQLQISDRIDFLKKEVPDYTIDENALEAYLSAGYTLGNKTFIKNIYQVQSCEAIVFKRENIYLRQFYFSYFAENIHSLSYKQIFSKAVFILNSVFFDLIKTLNNRTVVIPLSGGYDSRLIAALLKKYNYENVVCFTFGKKNNPEISNSEKTAKRLNFKWIFIEYSEDLIKNYIEPETFKKYIDYSGKYNSMPFMQDYFSVKYLFDNKIIPADSVFIPGHSGDFLGGSQLLKVIPETIKPTSVSKFILNRKFIFKKLTPRQKSNLFIEIETILSCYNSKQLTIPAYSIFEDFDLKEKLSKYILNSCSVFNFFGYEHRIPFWDIRLLSFFKDIPFQYKKGKLLYDDVLVNEYFNPFNLVFEKELQAGLKTIWFQNFKNRLKPFFPRFILNYFLRKNDWKNYEIITAQMLESMKKNKLAYNLKIKNYNEIIIQWYSYYIKGLIQ